jgi:hypothetical protein
MGGAKLGRAASQVSRGTDYFSRTAIANYGPKAAAIDGSRAPPAVLQVK